MIWYWRAQILFVIGTALFGGWKFLQHQRFVSGTMPVTATVASIDRLCFDDAQKSHPFRCTRDQLSGAYKVEGSTTHYIFGEAKVSLDWLDPQSSRPFSTVLTIDGQDPRFYSVAAGDSWNVRVERSDPGQLAQS